MEKGVISTERLVRIGKIEKLIVRGFTDSRELAARFGVTPQCVLRDIRYIKRKWKKREARNRGDRRRYRTKQLEAIVAASWDSFERSKKNQVEITVSAKTVPCPNTDCEEGFVDDQWCPVCEGDGEIKVGTEVHKTKGSVGDTNHLRVAESAIKEINKLEGNHAEKKVEVKGNVNVGGVVGLVAANIDEAGEWSQASPQKVLEAMEFLHDLRTEDTTYIRDVENKETEQEK